jgi:hypothetical protein
MLKIAHGRLLASSSTPIGSSHGPDRDAAPKLHRIAMPAKRPTSESPCAGVPRVRGRIRSVSRAACEGTRESHDAVDSDAVTMRCGRLGCGVTMRARVTMRSTRMRSLRRCASRELRPTARRARAAPRTRRVIRCASVRQPSAAKFRPDKARSESIRHRTRVPFGNGGNGLSWGGVPLGVGETTRTRRLPGPARCPPIASESE